MDCFSDASPSLGDAARLRTILAEDGCIFFRGLLESGRVLDVRREVLEALARSDWLAEASDPSEARPGAVIRLEETEAFWDGYTALQRIEALHGLALDAGLLAALEALVGDTVLVHPRKIARVSFPDSGFTTPPHQDFRYIQGAADVFTAWLPLGACPRELGGLRVLRGSHRHGLFPIHDSPGAGGLAIDVAEDDPAWASADYEPGDVIVFHSLTVHGALPNHTDLLRLSVDFRYQAVSDPVTNKSLHPHFHPAVPDWDELTTGWSSTVSVDAPDGLTLVGFDPPPSDLVVPPSRFVNADRLKVRILGDRRVGAVGLGAAGLSVGPHPTEADAIMTIVAALEAGITLIDSAACYVPSFEEQGHNEALIAKALDQWGGQADIVVATKAGIERVASGGTLDTDFLACARPEDIRRHCDVSLRALGTDAIDLYQLHDPNTGAPLAETMGAFRELQVEGKVRLVGLSNVTIEQIEEARTVVNIASVQNQFSPGNRTSADVIAYCEREGIAFLAYSPLGGLGERARSMPGDNPAFAEVAKERAVSAHRVALAWELALSKVIIPIPGARRPATIRDSAAAMNLELTEDEITRLSGPT